MSYARKHIVKIEIECLDPQSNAQAKTRVQNWLETYGYTSSGHGFDFVTIEQTAEPDTKKKV